MSTPASREMEALFVPSMALRDNAAKRAALVGDIGRFLACWLNIKFSCSIETHTTLSGRRRIKQLREGAPLFELVVRDGAASFEDFYIPSSGNQLSIDERRIVERYHSELRAKCFYLRGYLEDYQFLLEALENACRSQPYIDLSVCVRGDAGYFLPQMVSENIVAGGFSMKLSNALEERVMEWLVACEAAIEARFGLRDADAGRAVAREDATRAKRVHATLANVVARHVSMAGAFDDDLATQFRSPLNPNTFEELSAWIFDSQVRDRCEALRQERIQSLLALRPLCNVVGSEAEAARHVVANQDTILSTLRHVPKVLRERPGFASALEGMLVDFLVEIVKEAEEDSNAALIAVQLVEWSHRVGKPQLLQLRAFLDESVAILRKQVLPAPNAILPTLALVSPPMPTWCDPNVASESYVRLRASGELPKAVNVAERAYLPIPAATEKLMRIVSLAWELAGHRSTYDGFFAQGRVKCSIVLQTIPKERVNTEFVRETVGSWMQHLQLGQNYRNAVRELQHFRGSFVESELRTACRALSRWSLNDILTIAFEKSPLFYQNEFKILDSTIFAMPMACCGDLATMRTTSVIRKALEHACPIIFELRGEARVRPCVATGELGEFLLSIPTVREWGRDTPELVLTHDQVAAAGAEAVTRLRGMSTQRAIVHFGRRPAREKAVYGMKKVYTFSGVDLIRALAGASSY